MSEKKMGRPTECKKDRLLKIRVDKDTLDKLDDVSKEINISRSELVREVLPIISSKNFEESISLNSLGRLEKYSIECDKLFSETGFKIKESEVSEKFPAFVMSIGDDKAELNIKYPTYKIRMLVNKNDKKYWFSNNEATENINKFFKQNEVLGISPAYFVKCLLINNAQIQNSLSSYETFLPEVTCFKSTLRENSILKDQVCSLLKDNNIKSEVWPGYVLKVKPVNIIYEDGEEYVVVP